MYQWKKINNSLLEIRKPELIIERMYYRLRTTGITTARLYEFAKVRKKHKPLKQDLYNPGSYNNLNKFFNSVFEMLPAPTLKHIDT